MAEDNTQCSNRLLVNAIDESARDAPDQVVVRYPGPNWETDGYETITRKQLAQAVDRAAHWLDQQLEGTEDAHTVSYVGPNDPRYFILLTSTIKTGRRILLIDGRVTGDGTLDLLESTNCNIWITTVENLPTAEGLQVKRPGMRIIIIPALSYFLQVDACPPYPYSKTWADAKDDIVWIIHTSGTTGRPKPLYHTNRFISTSDSWRWLSKKYSGRKLPFDDAFGICSLSTYAPQWIAGMLTYFIPAFHDAEIAILPADAHMPLDIRTVIKILQKNPMIKGLMAPPQAVEDMYADELGVQTLKSLKFVSVTGAPLDQKIGDVVTQWTNLSNPVGSTEGGAQLFFMSSDPAAWKSAEFIPETGARFVPVSDDLFELYIDRRPDGELVQGILDVMDANTTTIAMKELWSPHRYADGSTRWVFRGRTDDLIKLNWLAKFYASDIEDAIKQHPLVEKVFIGGEARPVPFILIQLREQKERSLDEQAQIVDALFDHVISRRNAKDAVEIRVPKEMVMLTDSHRPFPSTLKGTISRKAVEDLYQDDIESMYRAWEAANK